MASTGWIGTERRSLAGLVSAVSWMAVLLVAIIGTTGVLTLYSVAGGSMSPWAMPHVVRLIAGFAVLFLVTAIPVRFWLAVAYPAYGAILAFIVAVMWLGNEVAGAQRWLTLGFLTFQPAEAMKVALILALARYYQGLVPGTQSRPRNVLVPFFMVALPAALILRQPDLGTAALLAGIGITVMFLSGANLLYFAGAGGVAAALMPTIWHKLHDYQKDRILTFLDPESDALGKGYQLTQSKIALGSGGFAGKGFLQGTQSQLDFVPEKHTDFIFTMFAEEMGFIGCIGLLLLYGLLIWVLITMALRCRHDYGRLLIMGMAVSLFLHVFVNMAMVMGAAPVVGVPLPLMSYGGSSMFALMVGLGLAMNAFVHRNEPLSHRDLGTLL